MTTPIPVVDGHNDLPWALRKHCRYDFDACDIAVSQPALQTDLPRLRRGGVRAQFWSVFVPGVPGEDSLGTGDFFADTCEQIDAVHRMVERYAGDLRLVTTADELDAVLAAGPDGPIGSMLGAEGGHSIDNSLGCLRTLYRLGVRYLTLTHNENNQWADSGTDEPEHGGLTDFGRQVVAEMNRLGMMVDLSHTAPSTMRDALDVSTAPVIFSHSCARAVQDHPRNVPDDVLQRMAAGGGVCMVTFVTKFLAGVGNPAHLEDVVRHLEHVREVAGIEHIGIGGDYDGTTLLPPELPDVSHYQDLFAALADRGWSRDDLVALGSRNIARVFRAVEDSAG